jgi:hypothetical protein
MLSIILLSRIISYTDRIIGDHQCGFRLNRSTTDQIYIRQILEKQCEYNGTIHQLFIDFKKTYNSVRREVLYNILIQFEIPRKIVGLINMCWNETYSRLSIGKIYCSEWREIRRYFITIALEHDIRRVQEKQEGLKLNEIHKLLAYSMMLIFLEKT